MANRKNIVVTDYDYDRLRDVLEIAEANKFQKDDSVEDLKKELQKANIVSSKDVPGDVITMNSRILLEDLGTRQEFSFQVVFPSDSDLDAGKISILAPIGTALLGYKTGDIVKWPVPGGRRKLKIKKMLYQPELEGDLYL